MYNLLTHYCLSHKRCLSIPVSIYFFIFLSEILNVVPSPLYTCVYTKEEPISVASCPLQWWRENSSKYPYLAKLAKFMLSVPATSVASERVFSTAGDVVTATRSALSPDLVDQLIFLKKNLK